MIDVNDAAAELAKQTEPDYDRIRAALKEAGATESTIIVAIVNLGARVRYYEDLLRNLRTVLDDPGCAAVRAPTSIEAPQHYEGARASLEDARRTENLSRLCEALEARNVSVALTALAGWTTVLRDVAQQWIDGGGEMPAFLGEYRTASESEEAESGPPVAAAPMPSDADRAWYLVRGVEQGLVTALDEYATLVRVAPVGWFQENAPERKKGGRPRGSKNKPKPESPAEQLAEGQARHASLTSPTVTLAEHGIAEAHAVLNGKPPENAVEAEEFIL